MKTLKQKITELLNDNNPQPMCVDFEVDLIMQYIATAMEEAVGEDEKGEFKSGFEVNTAEGITVGKLDKIAWDNNYAGYNQAKAEIREKIKKILE